MGTPMRSIAAFLAALLVLYAAGCDKSDNPVSHSETSTDVVLVVNSLGKTLSAIDFTQDVVLREVADLGNAPNQVVYKDKRVYVVNSLSNNIQVFKDTTLYPYPLLGTVSLGAGTNP